jgi:hypothetical protein
MSVAYLAGKIQLASNLSMSEFFRKGFQHGDNRSGNTALSFPKTSPGFREQKHPIVSV